MRKRLISCLLSLVLICSLLPANVLAEELRDEPIPTAEEVLPETEEPKAPMKTEESEAPAEQTGDTIRLLDDCEETVQISMNSKKNTPTQLTFDLNGHAIDGKGEKRCIVGIQANSATDRCTLTVKNGTLKNGAAGKESSGGAISWPCDLKIEDCTIEKNADKAIAVSFHGGNGSVRISGTDFIGNHEERPAGSGGAVSIAMDGTAEISDCTFTDNSADSMGGAIYCDHGELNITDCTFEKNEAAYGGAISAYASEVNIHGTLEGNTAARLGGGCYNSASMLNLNGAVICNNRAGTAGDDIFNVDAAAKLSLGGTGKQTLDDCGDQIDGWYEDGMPGTAENDDGTTSTVYAPRWDAHSEQNHVQACPAGTVEGALAVKAAHKVIVPMEPDEPDAPFHSKSKAATNLNSRYQSDVTLSLPAQQETLTSDVVFVLDKSTSAALEEQALAMLETLRTQIRETGGKVKVGVVIFNREAHATGLLDLETQGDAIEEAIQQTISSGTNTHAGLLAGKALLDDDKTVAASRKYLIFVSDGISYLFNESPTAVAWTFTQPGDGGTEQHFAGPDNWKVQYGSDDPPANWAETLQSIRDKVEKQGTEYDYAYDSGASEYTPAADQTKYANSVEKALCLTDAVYQAAKEEGYHCYAMTATQSEGRQYAWGPSFMAYLAGGESVSFDTIRNEIVYLLGAGSCVVDEIGSGTDNKGNAYHFDFVDDAANLALTVGGPDVHGDKGGAGGKRCGFHLLVRPACGKWAERGRLSLCPPLLQGRHDAAWRTL